MGNFFLGVAAIIIATATGLFRVLRGPTKANRLMTSQLLGSGGPTVTPRRDCDERKHPLSERRAKRVRALHT
jgi:hypothetical protein